jgi:hypothetical protein
MFTDSFGVRGVQPLAQLVQAKLVAAEWDKLRAKRRSVGNLTNARFSQLYPASVLTSMYSQHNFFKFSEACPVIWSCVIPQQ